MEISGTASAPVWQSAHAPLVTPVVLLLLQADPVLKHNDPMDPSAQ